MALAGRRLGWALVVLPRGLVGLVRGESVVERLQADAEHVGGLALGAALGERRLDQPPAHLLPRPPPPPPPPPPPRAARAGGAGGGGGGGAGGAGAGAGPRPLPPPRLRVA